MKCRECYEVYRALTGGAYPADFDAINFESIALNTGHTAGTGHALKRREVLKFSVCYCAPTTADFFPL